MYKCFDFSRFTLVPVELSRTPNLYRVLGLKIGLKKDFKNDKNFTQKHRAPILAQKCYGFKLLSNFPLAII